MSKGKRKKSLTLPLENPKLKLKGSSRKNTINIEGGILAGNSSTFNEDRIAFVRLRGNDEMDFFEALISLEKEIEDLQESTNLSLDQKQKIGELLVNIKNVITEVNSSKPKSSIISKELTAFTELADSLSGNIKQIITMSEIVMNLHIISKKIFL